MGDRDRPRRGQQRSRQMTVDATDPTLLQRTSDALVSGLNAVRAAQALEQTTQLPQLYDPNLGGGVGGVGGMGTRWMPTPQPITPGVSPSQAGQTQEDWLRSMRSAQDNYSFLYGDQRPRFASETDIGAASGLQSRFQAPQPTQQGIDFVKDYIFSWIPGMSPEPTGQSWRGGSGYPPPPTLSSFDFWMDDLDQQIAGVEQQRQQALELEAYYATAAYDAELAILERKIGEVQTAQANSAGVWAQWEQGAQDGIIKTVEDTQAAYATYVDLLNQGYSDYDALVESRFGEYEAEVRNLIQGYMDITQKSYQDFQDDLPGIWQPAIDAVQRGDRLALGAITKNAQDARDSIEGQVVASTDLFQQEMDRIRADNPALADELLADLREDAQFALDRVGTEEVGQAQIQIMAGNVARAAAQHGLASAMRQNEQERVSTINDAARQRHTLVTASNAQLDAILEESGLSRAQTMVQVDADEKARLNDLDQFRRETREESARAEEDMAFELSSSLQDLIDRYVGVQTAASTTGNRLQLEQLLSDSGAADFNSADIATGFMENWLSEQDITPNQQAIVAGIILDGLASGQFDTTEEVDAYAEAQMLMAEMTDSKEVETYEADRGINFDSAYAHNDWAFTGGFVRNGLQAYLTGEKKFAEDQANSSDDDAPAWQFGGGTDQQTSFGYRPFEGSYNIISQYGAPRADPGLGGIHHGIDIDTPMNTPLFAVQAGELTTYRTDTGGISVRVTTPDGYVFKYLHLAGSIKPQTVRAGQRIAASGNSGKLHGGGVMPPHLHFEVLRPDGSDDTNPARYLLG